MLESCKGDRGVVLALWGKVCCYMVVGFQSQVSETIVGNLKKPQYCLVAFVLRIMCSDQNLN